MKTILTIAGFDPSGGAGVLADIKTISRFGCFGVAAVTSLTLQNTQGVFGAYHQAVEAVTGQLNVLFDDFEINAIKIGMLPSRELVEAVADLISLKRVPHIVVDPVLRSTSGSDLIDDDSLRAIVEHLLPLASVVTPNAVEAGKISGHPVHDMPQMETAARQILAMGPQAVLVTGGDIEGEFATDLLVDGGGAVEYSSERVRSKDTHGTGCTLSSALACLLAQGHSLNESIAIAKRYLIEAIKSAPGLGRGRGPLNHGVTGDG
jgi:hydroxymethylpyrimidine kinase/phosphomethylpyrimidine kinase